MINHPKRASKDQWDADGPLAIEICTLLGWDATVHPVETRRSKVGVEVRGTALKPDEWMDLCLVTEAKLSDGSRVIVCDVPRSAVDLSHNILVRRQGRTIMRRDRGNSIPA